MRNYTSKSQKIDLYSEKYGLPKEEINRILSEHEDLLTLEELKIKYDNPAMGVFPAWLKYEDLENMIWKTIHSMWSITLQYMYESKDELFNDLYLYTCIKSNLWLNHNHLKGSLVFRVQTLIDNHLRKAKYWKGSIDEKKSEDDDEVRYRYDPYIAFEDTEEATAFNLIEKINSVKDESIRNILIITGYLICNIDSLRGEYLKLLNKCNASVKTSIKKLEQLQFMNDELDRLKIENNPMPVRKERITVVDIAKALQSDTILPECNKITLKKLTNYFHQNNLMELFGN